MKLKTYMIIGLLLMTTAYAIDKIPSIIETYDLMVWDDLVVADDVHFGDVVEIDGNILVDGNLGWSGTCDGDNLQVYHGVVIGCGYE